MKNQDMEAWLTLVEPEDGRTYSYDEIYALLKKQGVVEGLKDAKIHAMVKKKIYNRNVLIAEGKPQIDGMDGYFEYSFETKRSRTPEIRDDGSVDYTSINVITCVQKGDIIAMYHPSVAGRAGVTVRAKIVKPKPARELKPYACMNVAYDPANMIYRAETEGRVELTKTQIKIVDVQEFDRDIDNVFGNINFNGDVIIHGDVKPGVTIKASRSVTVEGVLEGGIIEAGGDVLIKGGIVGEINSRIHSQIRAGGDVVMDFVQYSTITSNKDIYANSYLGCNVTAQGKIFATGSLGAIVGGTVYGMMGVETSYSGNDAGLRTVIKCGISDELSLEKTALDMKLRKVMDEMQKSGEEEDDLNRMIRLGTASDMQKKRKAELVKQKLQLTKAVGDIRARLLELEGMFERGKNPKIMIENTAYVNTVAWVDDQFIQVDDLKRQVQFGKNENDNIVMRPMVKW